MASAAAFKAWHTKAKAGAGLCPFLPGVGHAEQRNAATVAPQGAQPDSMQLLTYHFSNSLLRHTEGAGFAAITTT
jgi:hypothetical protein